MNPKMKKCVNSKTRRAGDDIMCSLNESRCGNTCYDPKDKDTICYDNITACRKNEKLCSQTCFNPQSQQCLNNTIVCQNGDKLCLNECFNPDKQICYEISYSPMRGDYDYHIKPI